MGVNGWVDIHGHFSPPMSEEARQSFFDLANKNCFLLSEPWKWTYQDTLSYMDKANIKFQFLSNIPGSYDALKASNDYGASIVTQHPSRFGLLAAIPTENPGNALSEIARARGPLKADGYAVTCCYDGTYLSDPKLDPVWEELNRLQAVVFIHPNAVAPPTLGRPQPLIEVAFETCRTLVSMLYDGHFARYPDIKFIVAHCGGTLPVLASRLQLLGCASWVPNPRGLTPDEIKTQLSSLYLDTAASCPSGLGPALEMTSPSHIVYGADCGVACSTEETMEANKAALLNYERLSKAEIDAIGTNVLSLFPRVAARLNDSM
ncbi:unnamed protein product [Clonostachys rosea f. rosea IK726]|uniref:Uncharacterized protein n=1 Tax=Clonostachys rosea f. rosea IK726 TaxID=1349383 RepID=A0ACA9U9L3_BIOOC|nr:unnamed protein product [Clonostachys rosea f. rosea IK726]